MPALSEFNIISTKLNKMPQNLHFFFFFYISNSVFTNTENMDKADQFFLNFFFIKKSPTSPGHRLNICLGGLKRRFVLACWSRCCKQYEKSTRFNQTMCPLISKFTMSQQQTGTFTVPAGHLGYFWSLEMTNRLRSGHTCKTKAENTRWRVKKKNPTVSSEISQRWKFKRSNITIESILLKCLRCLNRPAPAERTKALVFDIFSTTSSLKTIKSSHYFSQKPFVFGQDPAAVLHCYI